MKLSLLPLSAAAVLLLLNGCQVPAPTPAPSPTPMTGTSSRDAEIARILDLKARGVISDSQAVESINALMSGNAVPASAQTIFTAPPPVVESSLPPPVVSTVPPSLPAATALPAVSALDARYQPEVVLQGRLRSVGSDTMDLLVGSWERVFRLYHPSLRVIHEGRGTSTATPALMENQSDIGPMSRPLLDAETARFRERFGYDATQIRTALDALGIYVHPDNPLAKTGLTLAQVDAIFSSTRNRGESEHIATWGQLGLGAEWANAPIRAYGRNRASGTYGFFRDTALGKGEFGAWVAEQPSSALVVTNVEGDKFGIGFSGVGYRTDGVAMVPLAKEAGGAFVSPSETTALDGSYALARPLLIALNRNPELPLSDLQREFTTFILGPIGQEIVKQEGYYPLPREIINEELAKLR